MDEWRAQMKTWLRKEETYEKEELNNLFSTKTSLELERNYGVCLRSLEIKSFKIGLFGKFELCLSKEKIFEYLNEKQIAVGVQVRLSNQNKQGKKEESSTIKGMVIKIDKDMEELVLSLDVFSQLCKELLQNNMKIRNDLYRIDLIADETTYKRTHSALDNSFYFSSSKWERIFFDPSYVLKQNLEKPIVFKTDVSNLNANQLSSIENCLRNEDLCIIHGPPGKFK